MLTVDYYFQNFGKKLKRRRRAFYLPNLVLKLPVDESWSLPSRDLWGRIERDRQKITRCEGGTLTMRTASSSSICTWRLSLPSCWSPALSLVFWVLPPATQGLDSLRCFLSFPHNLSFLLDRSNWHSNTSKISSVVTNLPTPWSYDPLPTAQLSASCHWGNSNQSFLFSLPQLSFYFQPTSIRLTCSA